MSEKPKIVSAEEVSRRTGIPAKLLSDVQCGINAMLNDEALKRRVDAMYYSGTKLSEIQGFDWIVDLPGDPA